MREAKGRVLEAKPAGSVVRSLGLRAYNTRMCPKGQQNSRPALKLAQVSCGVTRGLFQGQNVATGTFLGTQGLETRRAD